MFTIFSKKTIYFRNSPYQIDPGTKIDPDKNKLIKHLEFSAELLTSISYEKVAKHSQTVSQSISEQSYRTCFRKSIENSTPSSKANLPDCFLKRKSFPPENDRKQIPCELATFSLPLVAWKPPISGKCATLPYRHPLPMATKASSGGCHGTATGENIKVQHKIFIRAEFHVTVSLYVGSWSLPKDRNYFKSFITTRGGVEFSEKRVSTWQRWGGLGEEMSFKLKRLDLAFWGRWGAPPLSPLPPRVNSWY